MPSKPLPISACLSLATLANGNEVTVVALPGPPEVVPYAPILEPLLDRSVDQPVAAFFRQPWPRDWVLAPEVSLGPAFQSLAPPCTA
jgi:hypothetical protein